MVKLKLEQVKKVYKSGEEVIALKEISIGFRESEFVSILGPSGCGKTTMLNIIGGLDQYDGGDLIINELSTKKFKDSDWDAYRNHSIGFVFQSYNLIGHQTILENVEIALTLSGISASERKRRAKQALIDVGLEKHLKKKPNQLSGGQMQRVAIARALVNDPDIILADEPTGALDSQNSIQIMKILREISRKRLVIMVTHNGELAEEYSDRIVRLLDGEVQSDSNPVDLDQSSQAVTVTPKQMFPHTAMSMATAGGLSFKNLLTKRGRTITTAFAGSIGIIGVALVLSLSNGLSGYMSSMQSDTLSGYPVTVSSGDSSISFSRFQNQEDTEELAEYPDADVLYAYDSEADSTVHTNVLTDDYLDYISEMQNELPDMVNDISYTYGVNMNLLAKGDDTVVKYDTVSAGGMFAANSSYWQQLPDNEDFILSMYDLVGEGSRMPEAENEVVLVVDEYNQIDKEFFEKLGITEDTETYKLSDFIGKTVLSVVSNDDFYTKTGDFYTAASPSDYESLFENPDSIQLKIVGILRQKEDSSGSYLSAGIAYTADLAKSVLANAKDSEVAAAQENSETDVFTGMEFTEANTKEAALLAIGADTMPTAINIYPVDYDSKDAIKEYLDAYNTDKAEDDQLVYTDLAETITSMTGTLLDTVTYVLIGFAAISLVVSTIMISIITYVSVIERTKEIGILRSVGARKKDISRVFNAETLIIGFISGTLGVALTYLLNIPINAVIEDMTGIASVADMKIAYAVVLILGSMLLTLLAGFIPSRMAAKKDPVVALRSE